MSNKTIWKFELSVTDYQEISMPAEARILSVQTQNEKPCIWAIVDPNEKSVSKSFTIYGTGSPFYDKITNSDQNFIGTFHLMNDSFIGHLFELTQTIL